MTKPKIKTFGPGKYDDSCTLARVVNQAEGAIVIIINGDQGSGFSVQAPEDIIRRLPEILESMSKQIREDLTRSVQ